MEHSLDERLEKQTGELTEQELLSGGFEQAWQVHRSSFDAILFEEASFNKACKPSIAASKKCSLRGTALSAFGWTMGAS